MKRTALVAVAAAALASAGLALGAGASQGCGTYSGRGCAPAGARVDLARPSFTNPTRITNPLFSIGRLRSAVLLGRAEGKAFRSETTLLPGTSSVVWNGRRIRVRLSQYMAFTDGRLEEVALDRYAQADDGSVWYLGEDVADYRNGTAYTTEGTWLAGRDGPPAMIMPARPRVGDVFRTENVPGVVFEEVTVKGVNETVRGPHGPVRGAMVGSELHLDGSRSPKTFAPGYGEFLTLEGHDVEALALAAPIDRLPGPVPASLSGLVTGAFGILEDTRVDDREAASSTAARLRALWPAVREVSPPLIEPLLREKLTALDAAVRGHRAARTAQLAIDVARFALDLELRYRPVAAVDVERFHLWTQQLRVDAASGRRADVEGDMATLEWVRDRIAAALPPGRLRRLDAGLEALRTATTVHDLPAAADEAARLGALVRRSA